MCGVADLCFVFFFKAEDGIRDLVRSRGLGDVYKRQAVPSARLVPSFAPAPGVTSCPPPLASRCR